MDEKRRWANDNRSLAVALVQPGVRMVIVQVWICDEQPGHDFVPVLAIESHIKRCFSKGYVGNHPRTCDTEKELIENGWDFQGQHVDRHAIYLCPEGFLMSTEEDDLVSSNGDGQLAVCPWPPEQDEEKLADVVAALTEKVRKKLAHKEAGK